MFHISLFLRSLCSGVFFTFAVHSNQLPLTFRWSITSQLLSPPTEPVPTHFPSLMTPPLHHGCSVDLSLSPHLVPVSSLKQMWGNEPSAATAYASPKLNMQREGFQPPVEAEQVIRPGELSQPLGQARSVSKDSAGLGWKIRTKQCLYRACPGLFLSWF